MKYLTILLLLFASFYTASAQVDTTQRRQLNPVPVFYHGDTLFSLYGPIGPFSAEARASAITDRLDQVIKNSMSLADTMNVVVGEQSTDILVGDRILMSVTDSDAAPLNIDRTTLALQYQKELENAINKKLDLNSPKSILLNIGLLVAAVLIFLLLVYLVRKTFDFFRKNIKRIEQNFLFRDNRFIKIFQYITPRRERDILLVISRSLRYSTYLLALFFYLPLVFAYLPWTRPYVQQVWGYIARPLSLIWNNLTAYLPNLFFIALISFFTHYLVRFLKYLASEIEREKIVLTGFYGDWAMPTFKLIRVLVLAFALIVIFPYLPGSDSPAFQGVSIFLGLLLSLGSSTAVANVVAGIVITYMRPFQIGDRVKIGDTVGDVLERSLLVTRLKTIKNENITIPNAQILGGQLKNYTRHAEELGLILNTTITIGYDVPWEKVEGLLIKSAQATKGIEVKPAPFVLKTSLDDFYVSYQLNAYTKLANKGAGIYSEMHQHILDLFHQNGVEILSPHYGAQRDGNIMTVPVENLPKNYKTPGFRVEHVNSTNSDKKENS